MKRPRVSIVTFCRNGEKTIRRCVDSVLNQSYGDIQYVVQDGASTDGTLQILESYGSRIELVSAPDLGTNDGFWRALQRCTGDIIGCCLADETLLPGAIERAVRIFEKEQNVAAVTGNCQLIDIDGNVTGEHSGSAFDLTGYLLGDYCPIFVASFFRRQALVDVGFFDRRWKDGALDTVEFEMWCRLGSEKTIHFVPEQLAQYGIHEGQLSHNANRVLGELASRSMIVDRYLFGQDNLFGVDVMFRNFVIQRQYEIIIYHFTCHNRVDVAAVVTEEMNRVLHRNSPVALAPVAAETMIVSEAQGFVAAIMSPPVLLDQSVARPVRYAISAGRVLVPRPVRNRIPLSAKHAFVRRIGAASSRVRRAVNFLKSSVLPGRQHESSASVIEMKQPSMTSTSEQTAAPAPVSPEQIARGTSYLAAGTKYAERGLVEQAIFSLEKASILNDPYVDSLVVQLALKAPAMTDPAHLGIARRWAEKHARHDGQGGGYRFPAPDGRITVGYHCGFWKAKQAHAQALTFIAAHDRRRFRIIGYSPDRQERSVTSCFDDFRVTGDLSDSAFADAVRADKVDVFVELTGFSMLHRLGAMNIRCAPVQVSSLNHTGTTGINGIDYVIGDAIALPMSSQPYYTENIYQLPGCFFAFSYDEKELPKVAPLPARKNGYVTFGCYGGSDKLNRTNLQIWADLLRRIPTARLILQNAGLNSAANRDFFARQFRQMDIDPARLTLLPGADREQVLKNYSLMDISLDTWPYSGGNTIAESVWQGVPPLTFTGERFASRYGASLVTACGLPDFVGESPEDMIDIAERLSGDLVYLSDLRRKLRGMAVQFGLSDQHSFARRSEVAYEDMLIRRNV